MPAGQRAYLGACAGVIAWALIYVAVDYARLPRLVYDPVGGGAAMGQGGGLLIGYFGVWLWALLGSLVAGITAWALAGVRKRPISERFAGLTFAWTLTAMAIAVIYYTWNNWP